MPGFEFLYPAFLTIIVLAAGARLPAQWNNGIVAWFWAYTIPVVVLSNVSGIPFYSTARFLLFSFPSFLVMGQWGRKRPVHLLFVSLGGVFLVLSTMLFVQWYWVA